jgi:hypothetical protein
MKRHSIIMALIIIVCFLQINAGFSQSVSYLYDDYGNRKSQTINLFKTSEAEYDSVKYDCANEKQEYIEHFADLKISLYPNPTQDIVHILINGVMADENPDYYLFNMQGKLIFSKQITNNSEELDFSSYPAGYYLLKLKYKESVSEFKIVKQ